MRERCAYYRQCTQYLGQFGCESDAHIIDSVLSIWDSSVVRERCAYYRQCTQYLGQFGCKRAMRIL